MLAVLITTAACAASVEAPAPPPRASSLPPPVRVDRWSAFREDLAPYGTWVETLRFGWAWSPDRDLVGDDFMPYVSAGHWQPTDVGWMWMSDWSWGWAPFHYGRWAWDQRRGWLWIPDAQWAPAWVEWRAGSAFVGWAALPPLPRDPHEYQHSFFVFARREDLGAARIDALLLPAYAATDALASTEPVRDTFVHDGRAWYTGPVTRPEERKLRITPPQSSDLPPTGVVRRPPRSAPRAAASAHGLPGGAMPRRGLPVVARPAPPAAAPPDEVSRGRARFSRATRTRPPRALARCPLRRAPCAWRGT
jgi:hypothetical protein